MDLLIKSAKIIDSNSSFHLATKDILIIAGKIDRIADSIKREKVNVLEVNDLHISSGWIDLHSNIQDPGFEHKEDLNSGLKAAAAGGFTTIAVSPLTNPTRDSKAQIEYLVNKSSNNIIQVLPYGCISKNAEGKELAELNDMYHSGAIGFFDGKRSIKNPNLLIRALMYTKSFDGLVINFPHTEEVSFKGTMNEGKVSTSLGLKGIPEIAEELMVSRDLQLLQYTDGKLHLSTISAAKSVKLIQEGKEKGLKISCDIASYTLLLEDQELETFDSRFKTLPPLRTKETIIALKKGIKSGIIEAICSDHTPEDLESKKREFDHAAFGIINLQTAFSTANTALKSDISIDKIIALFTSGPRKILGLPSDEIKEGNKANLTLFQPNTAFKFSKEKVISKANNSPFFGKNLTGNVIGIINKNKISLN